MGEGNLIDSALYLVPLLVIDAIGIDDLLHIIISKCGELERESVVDMRDGIQIDDAYFNLIDTNARCKILLKNYMETVSNNSFGDYKEILDNLYEVNNFAEIHQILEFNYADFKL